MSTRLIKTITSGTSKARSDIYIDRRAKEYIVRHYTAKGVYMGQAMIKVMPIAASCHKIPASPICASASTRGLGNVVKLMGETESRGYDAVANCCYRHRPVAYCHVGLTHFLRF